MNHDFPRLVFLTDSYVSKCLRVILRVFSIERVMGGDRKIDEISGGT